MARPLRIEFAGALYHVTARGNAREDIYRDDEDRPQFLMLLQNTVNRHDWYCHAYCLMDNHYHLLVETHSPTLSKGMKFLNGTYTQYFFAERYKTRDESLAQAYRSGHYTLAQVGEHFGVSYATVSRAVKRAEGRGENVKRKASYPSLANNESAGNKIADVIEKAESGDVG